MKEPKATCLNCGWIGYESDCELKKQGAYCGPDDNYDIWGWEEWEDYLCPKCDKAIEVF